MNALLFAAVLYGALNAQTNLVIAPYLSKVDGANRVTVSLDEQTANRIGYKMVIDVPPTTDTNHYAVVAGWEERDTDYVVVHGEWPNQEPLAASDIVRRIYRVYEIRTLPPAPARRIYKYDLSAACIEYGEITNLITFISADVGVKWMWDAAEILVENDPYFIAATNEIVQSGIISETKVKAILDRAYELGQVIEVSK